MNEKDKEDENTLAYTELIKQISYGNIEKIEMTTGSTSIKVKVKNAEEEKKAVVPETIPIVSIGPTERIVGVVSSASLFGGGSIVIFTFSILVLNLGAL